MFLPSRQAPQNKFTQEQTFTPPKRLVFARGAIEVAKIIVPYSLWSCILILFYNFLVNFAVNHSLLMTMLAAPLALFVLGLAAMAVVAITKWIVIGRYKSTETPLWSILVWRSEFINSLWDNLVTPLILGPCMGTPFVSFFMRLMGCHIGKKVYMETKEVTEFDLVNIADGAQLNWGMTIQTHLFEDRVMKMSNLKVGENCSIGPMSVVLYDSEMCNDSTLLGLSLLMKGETLPGKTHWQGSPARTAHE